MRGCIDYVTYPFSSEYTYWLKYAFLSLSRAFTARAHPANSHCSHLLLNCRVATNTSHWLKVNSRWFTNQILHICEKVYFDQLFWGKFPILLCLFLHTLLLCHINSLDARFFNTIWLSNIMDPDQNRHFLGLIWVRIVCKGYQHRTKVPASRQTVKFLAKTLAKINLIWLHPFNLAKVLDKTNSEPG